MAISCSNSRRRALLLGWGLGSQLSQWRCERKPAVSAFIQGEVGLARLAPEVRHGAPGARPAKRLTLRHVLSASMVQAGRQTVEFRRAAAAPGRPIKLSQARCIPRSPPLRQHHPLCRHPATCCRDGEPIHPTGRSRAQSLSFPCALLHSFEADPDQMHGGH